MNCHCITGWACEQHPDLAWSHDDCPGARVRCNNLACPWWQGSTPAALETRWADKHDAEPPQLSILVT
jgi:hypothetical protein